GGFFQSVLMPSGMSPKAIVVDPDEWHTAYVLDDNDRVHARVFKLTIAIDDAGNITPTWTELTFNLNRSTTEDNRNGAKFRTIELVKTGPVPVLLVGGEYGIYRLINPGTELANSWSAFGAGLPSATVSGLHYYPPATIGGRTLGDVLVVATLGRGVWT